jgi:5-methylthioribose kinase
MTTLSLLTVDTVAEYVRKLRLFPPDDSLVATEITDGTLNFAFRVAGSVSSIFVKQTPDFIKVLGPTAKLSNHRLHIERGAYAAWEKALMSSDPEALACLPRILNFDEDRMIMVMEDLRFHAPLQDQLVSGIVSVVVASKIGCFLGCVHGKTHSALVSEDMRKHFTFKFANQELRQLQLEQFFTDPYQKAKGATPLRSDVEFMEAIDNLKAKYRGENWDNLSLCHGDFHSGSVMVEKHKEDSNDSVASDDNGLSVKVIDPEFAIYGPPGLDLGCLISGYVLACVHCAVMGVDSEQIRLCHSAVAAVWKAYKSAICAKDVPEVNLKEISSDAVGFAGCEVARNALHGLSITEEQKKMVADKAALALGVKFVKGRALGVDELLVTFEGFCRHGISSWLSENEISK